MVTGAERCKMRVPEKEGGGHFIHVGSSECVKFSVTYTKLGTPVHYEKVIKTPYKKLTLGAHCTCKAVH